MFDIKAILFERRFMHPILWQGDCLELMQSISDKSIDAIIHDPPYGTTQCEWDVDLDLSRLWYDFKRIIKPSGIILVFSAQPFTSKLILSQPEWYRYIWYWAKEKGTNFFRTAYQPLRIIEEIVVFSPGANYTYHPQLIPLDVPYTHTMPLRHSDITGRGEISDSQTKDLRDYKTYTHRQPTNLIKFSRESNQLMPSQKPVPLLEYLIRTYTNKDDLVLDPTMGTGSIGVACARLRRRFHGIELDAKHFGYAKQRVESEEKFSRIVHFN